MGWIIYLLYFLVGGIVIALVTYFATQAKGLLAAFIANLPTITLITFLTIYFSSGSTMVLSYAKGLIIMLLPWLSYILSVIFLTPRLGFLPSLTLGFLLYLLIAYLILTKGGLRI
ncbi:MAG: DUF3147 domain-containing protein [Candidatus Aenigmarchaeota archaeon]|nr:DUF3147 domain-containing protein [Candidatus Aenigmarchaeota archaeon]